MAEIKEQQYKRKGLYKKNTVHGEPSLRPITLPKLKWMEDTKPVCKNKGNVGVFADGACEVCYADQGEKCLKEKL
jgi:hypothetical protein